MHRYFRKVIPSLVVLFVLFLSSAGAQNIRTPYTVPVVVVKYFPVKGDRIDIKVTGDWGETLKATRKKTEDQTKEIIAALEKGSTYHGYKNPFARPSLKYRVVKTFEFRKPLPTVPKPGHNVPFTDYNRVMAEINAKYWVESRGVKEIWIWGYHGGVIGLWESNMSSPHGDISNSDRDPKDLPVFDRTYTVYHYNYQRGTSEATEDHMHQIEAVLRSVDNDLFWNEFVGQKGEGRCGWSHYPPNAEHDYDWVNKKYAWTDIEDWKPEGGKKKKMNSDRWNGDSLQWFMYWMQNVPGEGNRLSYRGKPLTNWWIFIGEYDYAIKNGLKL